MRSFTRKEFGKLYGEPVPDEIWNALRYMYDSMTEAEKNKSDSNRIKYLSQLKNKKSKSKKSK